MRAPRRIIHPSVVLLLAALAGCATTPAAAPKVTPRAQALPREPDAAFRWLQERLLAANTIDLAVEVESGEPYPSLLTGSVELEAGNRLELAVDGEFKGEKVNLRLRSRDGRLVGGRGGPGDTTINQATPTALGEAMIVGLVHMGITHNLALLVFGQPPDHADGGARKWLTASDHVWDTGRDTTIDGREGRALAFQLAVDGRHAADVVVWLDRQTGLPLRREVQVKLAGEGGEPGVMKVSESYLKFEVSP